jgi:hypothetical protein
MRNVGGILLILGLLAVFLLPGLSREAAAPQAAPAGTDWLEGSWPNSTGTPRAALPMVIGIPTLTPTKTPTPTATLTPSATLPNPQSIIGSLRREDPNKPSYATNIEDIWHWFWIRNNNLGRVYYGVLGVNVYKDDNYNFFHTSWSGELAPNGVLFIEGGGCYGPNSYPCAGSSGAAEQRDKVIVTEPGSYTLSLHICQSSFNTCTDKNGGGNWSAPLSQVTFVAIHWTPSAPSPDSTPVPHDLAEPCKLITDGPYGTYLDCKK